MQQLKLHNRTISIIHCTIGQVVAITDLYNKDDASKYVYGHLVGFGKNCFGELLFAVRVDVADSEPRLVHPCNCLMEFSSEFKTFG